MVALVVLPRGERARICDAIDEQLAVQVVALVLVGDRLDAPDYPDVRVSVAVEKFLYLAGYRLLHDKCERPTVLSVVDAIARHLLITVAKFRRPHAVAWRAGRLNPWAPAECLNGH